MKNPLSIYIHWPFCKAKCPYCDFNSHVREGVDHARWRAALLKELSQYAQKLPGREVVSIFFGGGTPSLMEAGTAGALIDAVSGHWSMAKDAEITLEANPTSIEAGHFREFRGAGVNRASVGIQALNMADLKFLGRQHSVSEALAALEVARATFPRFTFDLIYARPGQSLAAWEAELHQALAFADGHLSLYQLTIEENTAFHTAYRKGAFVMPEDGLAADMYSLTQELMEARGLPAYEISNHARAGQESRHNLAYWRTDDYIGIGPGAHGRYSLYNDAGEHSSPPLASASSPSKGVVASLLHDDTQGRRFATETIKSPERWLEKVEQGGTGLIAETALTERERLEEAVMMGLRLKGGIDYADWRRRTGLEVRGALRIGTLARDGFVMADDAHIEVTPKGRLLLNRITAELLATE